LAAAAVLAGIVTAIARLLAATECMGEELALARLAGPRDVPSIVRGHVVADA